jgi:hypothetical protein
MRCLQSFPNVQNRYGPFLHATSGISVNLLKL